MVLPVSVEKVSSLVAREEVVRCAELARVLVEIVEQVRVEIYPILEEKVEKLIVLVLTVLAIRVLTIKDGTLTDCELIVDTFAELTWMESRVN